MCKTWKYQFISLDPTNNPEDWDYSVDVETARITATEGIQGPLTNYKASSLTIEHLVFLKEGGYFDDKVSLSYDLVEQCEDLVDQQLEWYRLNQEDTLKLIQTHLNDFKFIGYSAESLQLKAGNVLIYDINSSVRCFVKRAKK